MSSSGKEFHGSLPATFDPIQLAERGERLVGILPLKSMPRLASACLDDTGDVSVDLKFERAGDPDMAIVSGAVSARVKVTCQRCLEPMSYEISAEPRLMFVRPAGNTDLDAEDGEMIEADKPVHLSELVEDELLLAMPMIPMHELEACPARAHAAVQRKKLNPFAVLKDRKPAKD